jgi:hypothetical protein
VDVHDGEPARRTRGALHAEKKAQCVVDRTQFIRLEPSRRSCEALRMDDRRLFDEDARLPTLDNDRRAKARRPRARRGRGNERRAEIEKLVPCTITAKRAPRCSWPRVPCRAGKRKTSPRGPSASGRWRELGHLLANGAHLFAIVFVGSDTPDLFADRRSDAAPRSRFAKSCAHGFRICQAIWANDVECRSRGIQPNVKRTCHRRIVAQMVLNAAGEECRCAGTPETAVCFLRAATFQALLIWRSAPT